MYFIYNKLVNKAEVLTSPFLSFLFLSLYATGKDQGTPLLKEGINCLGMEADEDESEGSDWAGYE